MSGRITTAYSVMGDKDRSEFQFSKNVSNAELLELLERNPRVSMLCDWMTAIALKNGFNLPEGSEEHLDAIHFMEKLHRAIMFGRLHGASMCRKFDAPIASVEDEEGDIIEETKTANFEVYHRQGGGNGWYLKTTDIGPNGQPQSFHLQMRIEKGKSKVDIVPAAQCVIFKNPKKRERWDGTPTSKLIVKTAILEELLLKITGKHALDIAGAFLWIDGVISDEHAASLHSALAEKPLSELYTSGISITPMMNQIKGSIKELKIYNDMLKDYMACAMRVSRQSMDGAAEGTLSSAEYNTIMTSDTIEGIQTHYTPYIIDLFTLIGYPNHKLIWNKPIEKLDKDGKETPSDPKLEQDDKDGKTDKPKAAEQKKEPVE